LLIARFNRPISLEDDAPATHGPVLVEARVPNGASVEMTVAALRKVAELLERHGTTILNEPVGAGSVFDPDGGPEAMLWEDFDDRRRLE
jgi:hypothetical protein